MPKFGLFEDFFIIGMVLLSFQTEAFAQSEGFRKIRI
jgi:hypothetical protein